MSKTVRKGKPKKVTELKVGNIILILSTKKKAKVTAIRKVNASADMEGLKKAPLKDTFYVVDYEYLDKKVKDDTPHTRTYRSGETVTWFAEKKRAKFNTSTLVVAALVGMLTGMSAVFVLMSWAQG